MKGGFYTRLAASGIKNNRKLYTPYILTCAGSVMMMYIMSALPLSPALAKMAGGDNLAKFLGLGKWVIAIFSLIFLFYTNSFLIRRRTREFGLYNVLGMGKKSIGRIMAAESLIITGVSLGGGLLPGAAFYKLAELGLLKLLKLDADYELGVSWRAALLTAGVFFLIFAAVYLRSRVLVGQTTAAALLQSEKLGETPPKANTAAAGAGVLLLGGAYYIAVSIKSPVSAMLFFFVAVIMVIIGTYLLMISGSVALCRALQKNKKYYYDKRHFVQVSAMTWRMKRNGAGLASICILCTMVLVMISSTCSLYAGAQDSLNTHYSRQIDIIVKGDDLAGLSTTDTDTLRGIAEKDTVSRGFSSLNSMTYRCAILEGYLNNGLISTELAGGSRLSNFTHDMVSVFIIPLSDYNAAVGGSYTLAKDEAFVYCSHVKLKSDTLTLPGTSKLNVRTTGKHINDGDAASLVYPAIYVIVDDFDGYTAPLALLTDNDGNTLLHSQWFYGFDISGDADAQIALTKDIKNDISSIKESDQDFNWSCESREANRVDFYSTFGSLLYLAIILSAVFICAAILIIYYKQICEGWEDVSRFGIMQKIGMTKHEIRRSVNSQVLTVFFLPLVMAGIHLAFAFPLIWKCLQLFSLNNINVIIISTVVVYLIFAAVYTLVYRLTSNSYYKIVSSRDNES